ncbi:17538_t:CDS:2, partial [Entrophospora sp. SA101]
PTQIGLDNNNEISTLLSKLIEVSENTLNSLEPDVLAGEISG